MKKPNKCKNAVLQPKKKEFERIRKEKHFSSVVAAFPEAFVNGKFCDVKIVCMDTDLWAHKIILGSVSPFLHKLITHYEKQGDDVITIVLPMIKGYHMKLVLDYIYSGAMYLCGAHMQYVIQVMEVLQLKCGVSVNKIVGQGSGEFIEVEHSTVTIKTEKDHDTNGNGVNDENLHDKAKGIYKLRRKSGTDPDPIKPLEKTKSVKRKRQSDADKIEEEIVTNGKPEKKKIKSILDELPKSNLEIIPLSAENKSLSVSTPSESTPDNPEESKKVTEKEKESHQTDDEEEVNDVVVVELDEEFVVEKVEDSKKVNSDAGTSQDETDNAVEVCHNSASHRCALCGRVFKHYKNLQVHLTGHLGVKVNIHYCTQCKKSFRNDLELQLHQRSHKAAKMLAGKRKKVSPCTNGALKPKVITTSGSADKKIIRKYMKGPDRNISKSKDSKIKIPEGGVEVDQQIIVKSPVKETVKEKKKTNNNIQALKKGGENLTCAICDKSFGVKSMFLRHVKKSHPELALTMESHNQLKKLPSINIKNCHLPDSPKVPRTPNTPTASSKKSLKPNSPAKSPTKSPSKSPMRQFSTPIASSPTLNSSKKKERTKSDSLAPELPDYYNTLECPDCERVFIAKSIFERHLQSAKHGIYSQVNTSNDSDAYMSPSPRTPTIPHWTESPLAGTDSGSGSPHKIECHLCGQSFVRVRDLAKHREKMCTAYHA